MPVKCSLCQKILQKQFNLNKHYKNVHNKKPECISYPSNIFNYKCLENECDNSFRQCLQLVQHLEAQHNFQIKREEKHFDCIRDFNLWKNQIETEEKCNYIIPRGKRSTTSNEKITYYICNRSARKVRSPETVKRRTKSQGRSKLQLCCISQMTVTENDLGIKVKRIVNHYGHDLDLVHLRISKLDRQQMAEKLMNGVPTSRVLDSVRSKIGGDLKRVHLVTLTDVSNIKRSLNIKALDGVKHSDGATSVSLWVTECRNDTEYNPVLFFKQQGKSLEGFKDSDFCLIIMNNIQSSLLTQFGSNIIAIDGTHGLNNCDLEITTIMVVDEYNEGFPVAFMFSNNKDTYIYKFFFFVLKQKVGAVFCKTLLTDTTLVYYNAWLEVMGEVEGFQHLFCSWHLDREWQNNLNKIQNKDIRDSVYETIKFLQQSDDAEMFQVELALAVQNMVDDVNTRSFGVYFDTFYSKNYEKWAYSFRKHCGINTNVTLESMHNVIKYLYLDGKRVKRQDKALHAVMKYVRDKIVDRITKYTIGKQNVYNKEIHQKHRLAITSSFQIDVRDNETWEITNNTNTYVVKKCSVFNRKCCTLVCTCCDICIHSYECTCQDFLIRATICKHIHFLVLKMNPQFNSTFENFMDSGIHFLSESISSNENNFKESILKRLSALQTQVDALENNKIQENVFNQIQGHLNTINLLLDSPQVDI